MTTTFETKPPTIAETLAKKHAAEQAEWLTLYRAAIQRVAAGETLSEPDLTEVLTATQILRIPTDWFDADARIQKAIQADAAFLATSAQVEKEIGERQRTELTNVQRLTVELAQAKIRLDHARNAAEIHQMQKQQAITLKKNNPRICAPIETARTDLPASEDRHQVTLPAVYGPSNPNNDREGAGHGKRGLARPSFEVPGFNATPNNREGERH